MDQISQKQINRIIEILEGENRTEETIDLANTLKAAEIIPAMYVLTYLKVIDGIRKKTQVLDESSETSKKYKYKKDDYESFIEELKKHWQLGISYFIDTPEKFETAMSFLYNALERKDMFCDYDDSKAAPTKIGRCENPDDHYEAIDYKPIVPLSEEQQKRFDELCEKENMSVVMDSKEFIEHFNPSNQELVAVHGWDEEAAKLLHREVYYICKHCQKQGENGDGGYPICDTELGA